MPKVVCFDLDGTLADTLADLANAVNFALENNGLEPYETARYRFFVGNGLDNLIRTTIAKPHEKALFDAVKADFQRYYSAHYCDDTTVYPGMSETLKALSDHGMVTAVLSNKPDPFVKPILKKLYPDHAFSLCYGQREQIARKPAPDALTLALEELGAEKKDAIYIGDSDVDVKFAHAAGVDFIGVKWGFRPEQELKDAGAAVIAEAPKDLIDLLLKA